MQVKMPWITQEGDVVWVQPLLNSQKGFLFEAGDESIFTPTNKPYLKPLADNYTEQTLPPQGATFALTDTDHTNPNYTLYYNPESLFFGVGDRKVNGWIFFSFRSDDQKLTPKDGWSITIDFSDWLDHFYSQVIDIVIGKHSVVLAVWLKGITKVVAKRNPVYLNIQCAFNTQVLTNLGTVYGAMTFLYNMTYDAIQLAITDSPPSEES